MTTVLHRTLLGAVPVLALLTACGSDRPDSTASDGAPSTIDDAYPLTIATPDDGLVTISAPPLRLAALLMHPLRTSALPFRAGRIVVLDAQQIPVTPPSVPVVLQGLTEVLGA